MSRHLLDAMLRVSSRLPLSLCDPHSNEVCVRTSSKGVRLTLSPDVDDFHRAIFVDVLTCSIASSNYNYQSFSGLREGEGPANNLLTYIATFHRFKNSGFTADSGLGRTLYFCSGSQASPYSSLRASCLAPRRILKHQERDVPYES